MSLTGNPRMTVNFTVKSYNQGQTIFREGQEGSYACIINSGKVAVVKSLAGRTVTLAVLEKGEVFGEMALVATEKRTASVLALEYTEVVVLDRERLLASLKASTPLAQSLIIGLIRRLAHTSSLVQKQKDDSEQMMGLANLLQAWTEPQEKDADGRVHLPYLKLLDYTKATLNLPAPRVEEILDNLAENDLLEMSRGRKGRELVLSKPEKLVVRTEDVTRKMAVKKDEPRVGGEMPGVDSGGDREEGRPVEGMMDLGDLAAEAGIEPRQLLARLLKSENPEALVYFSRNKAMRWVRELKGEKEPPAQEAAEPADVMNLEKLLDVGHVVLQKALASMGFDRLVTLLRGASPEARVIIIKNISPRMVSELPDITSTKNQTAQKYQDMVRTLARELEKAKLDLGAG